MLRMLSATRQLVQLPHEIIEARLTRLDTRFKTAMVMYGYRAGAGHRAGSRIIAGHSISVNASISNLILSKNTT